MGVGLCYSTQYEFEDDDFITYGTIIATGNHKFKAYVKNGYDIGFEDLEYQDGGYMYESYIASDKTKGKLYSKDLNREGKNNWIGLSMEEDA